ncbi:DUF3149 domain-containing protein [Litoribacillus peritrichatus]|uniref:DUF3149 domain-containing protein n=1 Tax=Litoribacillus peritrichatus TaxID=718191 RepID=A0ABP7MC04_9GAMM
MMNTFFDLFTSLSGILSLFVVVFVIGMGIFCGYMFISKMNAEGEEYDRTHPNPLEK